MNLKYLNLDLHGIPEDAEIQMAVYLIVSELRTKKLLNSLTEIGCDSCFCIPELCDVVLPLLDLKIAQTSCTISISTYWINTANAVTHKNDLPTKEALHIYKTLRSERQKYLNRKRMIPNAEPI